MSVLSASTPYLLVVSGASLSSSVARTRSSELYEQAVVLVVARLEFVAPDQRQETRRQRAVRILTFRKPSAVSYTGQLRMS